MRERAEQILKIVCAVLGLLLAIHLGKLAIHPDPLADRAIPDLPSLPAETNEVTIVANRPPVKPDTNSASKTKDLKTNATLASADNNAVSPSKQKRPPHSRSSPGKHRTTFPATYPPPQAPAAPSFSAR